MEKKAIKQLLPYQPQSILDIATGTGDFAIQSAKMLKPKAIIGADISTGMMEIGKKKVKEEAPLSESSLSKRGLSQLIISIKHV